MTAVQTDAACDVVSNGIMSYDNSFPRSSKRVDFTACSSISASLIVSVLLWAFKVSRGSNEGSSARRQDPTSIHIEAHVS